MDGYDDSAPNFDSLFSAAENRSYSSVQYSATVNKSVGILLTLILNRLISIVSKPIKIVVVS